jgi:hypothetical protein
VPPTGSEEAYTRGYYCDHGAGIVSGTSGEDVLRVHRAATGEQLHAARMWDGADNPCTYLQSLRGHPTRAGYFGVILANRDPTVRNQLVVVDAYAAPAAEDGLIEVGEGDAAAGGVSQAEVAAAATAVLEAQSRDAVTRASTVASPSFMADLWRLLQRAADDGRQVWLRGDVLAAYATVLTLQAHSDGAAGSGDAAWRWSWASGRAGSGAR